MTTSIAIYIAQAITAIAAIFGTYVAIKSKRIEEAEIRNPNAGPKPPSPKFE